MITKDDLFVASAIEKICDRALALSKEIKGLEEELKPKKMEYNQCFAELCYAIFYLEKIGSPHAAVLKSIVGKTDMEIGIEAGKYEAFMKYRREKTLKKKGDVRQHGYVCVDDEGTASRY